jgi:hypothetical protein
MHNPSRPLDDSLQAARGLPAPPARNFLGNTHERRTDARMLALNHWPNINCYQTEHPDARPSHPSLNPAHTIDRPKPASARNFLGNQILTPRPRIFSTFR